MSGNATYRYTDTAVLSVAAVDAPIVVTSKQLDDELAETYERIGLRPGMLEASRMRRRWPVRRHWPRQASILRASG
jgi:hypothetical protein